MLRVLCVLGIAALVAGCGSNSKTGPEDGGESSPDGTTDSNADGGGAAPDGALEFNVPERIVRYIRGDRAGRLVIEVDAVQGFAPYDSVKPRLVDGLESLLDKPSGVEVVMDETLDSRGEDYAWSDEELFELAEQTFNLEVPDGTVKMHALFVDGHRESDSGGQVTLGLAWAHRHMAIYKESLQGSCTGGLGAIEEQLCRDAEKAIWTHEVGHTIGLVDNGLPMVTDHRDPDHGPHDESDECVMYWAYENDAVVDELRTRLMNGGGQTLGFDQACRDDVAAIRDR
jgi:hypothetical protein